MKPGIRARYAGVERHGYHTVRLRDGISSGGSTSWVYAGKDYRGWWNDILGLLHPRFVVYLRSVVVIPTVHGGVSCRWFTLRFSPPICLGCRTPTVPTTATSVVNICYKIERYQDEQLELLSIFVGHPYRNACVPGMTSNSCVFRAAATCTRLSGSNA